MKKKLLVRLLLIMIIFSGITFFYFTKTYNGYEINKVGRSIEVEGELTKDNEYIFHTNVLLGEATPLSASILELELHTQVEFDKNANKYVLIKPKLEINPIGCEEYNKEQDYLTETEYSGNYQFGTKPYQSFKQTMDVGYAKLISNNKNIKINQIESTNSQSKINNLNRLMRTPDNKVDVVLDYNTLEQYFTQWYSIKFHLISNKKGEFNIE